MNRTPHPIQRQLIPLGASSLLLGLTAWALGQGQSQILLRDKGSNVVITNHTDFVVKRVSEKRVRVVANGTPLQVAWNRDGMVMKSSSFEGVVETVQKGSLELITAALKGNVTVTAQRGTDVKRNLNVSTGSANYAAKDRTLSMLSGLVVESWDSAGRLNLKVKGSQARFTLYPDPLPKGARSLIRTGNVEGPVSFEIRTLSASGEKGSIIGFCRELQLDDPNGKIILLGNVEITGDSPLLFGDIKATKAEIVLDATGEPDEIRVFGDPVTTQVDKKKPAPPSGGIR